MLSMIHLCPGENMKHEPQSQYKQKVFSEFLTNRFFGCLKVVHGDEIINFSKVWAWAHKANAGTINLFNDPRSGSPKMRQSVEAEQQIDEKIHQNRTIT